MSSGRCRRLSRCSSRRPSIACGEHCCLLDCARQTLKRQVNLELILAFLRLCLMPLHSSANATVCPNSSFRFVGQSLGPVNTEPGSMHHWAAWLSSGCNIVNGAPRQVQLHEGKHKALNSWSRVLPGNSIPRDVLPGFSVVRGRLRLLCANAQFDLGPELAMAALGTSNMAPGDMHGWHA